MNFVDAEPTYICWNRANAERAHVLACSSVYGINRYPMCIYCLSIVIQRNILRLHPHAGVFPHKQKSSALYIGKYWEKG